MATYFDSKESVFTLYDGAAIQLDLSRYLTSIDGLPGPRELIDVTPLNASGHAFIPSLENVVITIEMNWSDDANDSAYGAPDVLLEGMRKATAVRLFEYGPEGKTTGEVKYSGNCWLRNYQITSRLGSQITCRAELQVDGTVTRAVTAFA